VSLGNFLVLFAVFSHSQSISLAGLEENVNRNLDNSPRELD
jgi:hypothetical protein